MRKVLAAMPDTRRASATRAAARVTVRRGGFLREPASDGPLDAVREAVFAGRRLRIRYPTRGEPGAAGWRTVDPIGLVDAGGRWYLLATRNGADRTYRMSRNSEAVALDEPADRPSDVDLERLWEQRRAEFTASLPPWPATVLVRADRRAEVAGAARGVRAEQPDAPGWLRLELDFGGPEHAVAVLWRIGPDAEALAPAELRRHLAERAAAMAARYPTGSDRRDRAATHLDRA
jgi:predicted DNA-binding transcriptional regulator YafY